MSTAPLYLEVADSPAAHPQSHSVHERLPAAEILGDLSQLLGIARDALAGNPLCIPSVLGWPRTWIPPFDSFSEFRIADVWQLRRTLQFLVHVTVPSLPVNPPSISPPFLEALLWQPTVVLRRGDHTGDFTSFPDEAWFFINGILTDEAIAQFNAAFLSYLFHRPLTIIQNSTDAFYEDLLQCIFDKAAWWITEPVIKAFPVIYDALTDPHKRKVVVIAHSQGTIIASRVLALLQSKLEGTSLGSRTPWAGSELLPLFLPSSLSEERRGGAEFLFLDEEPLISADFAPLTLTELAKLELYCFANCANTLRYSVPPSEGVPPVPWMESFGNEHDLVAGLGMLAPHPEQWGIEIDGPCYLHPGAWGHLLNQHYLIDIRSGQKYGRKKGGDNGAHDPLAPYVRFRAPTALAEATPRLFAYINGGSPLREKERTR